MRWTFDLISRVLAGWLDEPGPINALRLWLKAWDVQSLAKRWGRLMEATSGGLRIGIGHEFYSGTT